MTNQSNVTTNHNLDTKNQLIRTIAHALKLAKFNIWLGWLAITVFVIFGTLSTLKSLNENVWVYYGFYVVPYVLIGIGIPVSLYHVFLMWRYQVIQATILVTMLCLAFGLFTVSTFMAMVAWFAMPYLFKVNLQKFLDFLLGKPYVEPKRKRRT